MSSIDRQSQCAKFVTVLMDRLKKDEGDLGVKELYGGLAHVLTLFLALQNAHPGSFQELIPGLPARYRYKVLGIFWEMHRKVVSFRHSPEEGTYLFTVLLAEITQRFTSLLYSEFIPRSASGKTT